MKISVLIRQMAAAGATPEAIAIAVEAIELASFMKIERDKQALDLVRMLEEDFNNAQAQRKAARQALSRGDK